MSESAKNTVVRLQSCDEINALADGPIDSTTQPVSLILSNCTLDVIAVANTVSILCSNQDHIQELELRGCSGDLGTIITVALTTCKKLESLSIFVDSSLAADSDRFLHALGAGLITSSSLSKLRLGIGSRPKHFTLSSDAARSLQHGLTKSSCLTSFHLANCRFQEFRTVGILAKGLGAMTSLKTFRLNSCHEPNGDPLEDEGVGFLIFSLANNCNLECLDLSRSKCLDEGMIALSFLLDRSTMRTLDLSHQQMTKYEYMKTFRMIGGMARSSTLEEVNLESNQLYSNNDMYYFASVLAHNTSIKVFNLSNNELTNSGMATFASLMDSMKGLQTLLIGQNDAFDDETSLKIAEAMKENTALQNIDFAPKLAHNKVVQYYTDLNWGGRKFIEQRKKDDEEQREKDDEEQSKKGDEEEREKDDEEQSKKDDDDAEPARAPIPLSVWPTILSRVSKRSEDNERRANLIYFYLQKGSAIFPV